MDGVTGQPGLCAPHLLRRRRGRAGQLRAMHTRTHRDDGQGGGKLPAGVQRPAGPARLGTS